MADQPGSKSTTQMAVTKPELQSIRSAPIPTTALTQATRSSLRWMATVSGEHEVSTNYRQGLAHVEGGWIFSTNNGLYLTDESFQQTLKSEPAIPANLSAQGYNHIGDIDVDADGYLWAPIERSEKETGGQVMARYNASSLKFIDSFTVPQHHNSFVTVDHDGTLYSTDQFDDDTLLRYKLVEGKLQSLPPLRMGRKINHIQGSDIADGAIWLSTDDDHNGLYRVDLKTGEVQDLGSMGYIDGEGEGIDASVSPSGLLHVLSIDVKQFPVRVIDAAVNWSPR
jgi:sugar lactone lactonase YvrE